MFYTMRSFSYPYYYIGNCVLKIKIPLSKRRTQAFGIMSALPAALVAKICQGTFFVPIITKPYVNNPKHYNLLLLLRNQDATILSARFTGI